MDYPESERGKCITCGFLAKHPTDPTSRHAPAYPKYYAIEMAQRESGEVWTQWVDRISSFPTEPICLREATNLAAEVRAFQRKHKTDAPSAAASVFAYERDCPAWCEYKTGLSPETHVEQYEMQQLEADRREYERQQEKDRREFEERLSARAEAVRLQLAERDERLQAQRDASQYSYNKLIKRITIFGIVLAVIQALSGVLTDAAKGAILNWIRNLFR